MTETLRSELWSRMREQLRHTTSPEHLKIMKVGGEADHIVTLFVFEPGLSSPTFCVKTVRKLEDGSLIRNEVGPRPHEGSTGAQTLIDLQGFPALIVNLREKPGETP